MLLKQIQYFVKIVELNNFTKAAEACFISQSAISRQIKLLEESLNVQLLVREKRQFYLTPAGKYFYLEAVRLLNKTDEIITQTQMIASKALHLSIGYLTGYANKQLGEAIKIFNQQFPDIEIDLVSGNH